MLKTVVVTAALALAVSACGGGSSHRNQAPSASGASLSTSEDVAVTGVVTATDPDSDRLTLQIATPPGKGQVTLSSSNPLGFTYTPGANRNGTDQFTFTATDGRASSNAATVTIEIAPLNDAPVVLSSIALDEDTAFDDQVATEVDGEAMTVVSTTQPAHGSLVLSATTPGRIGYTPAANFFGADQFEIRATDAGGTSSVQTVAVTVRPVNDAPQAVVDSARTTQGREVLVEVLTNDTDVEGDALTVSIPNTPSTGTATVNVDGSIRYVPTPAFVGVASFTYRLRDAAGATADATVDVAVGFNYVSVFKSDRDTPGTFEIYVADGTRTLRVNAPLQAGEQISAFKVATGVPVVVYGVHVNGVSRLKKVDLHQPGVAVDLPVSGDVAEFLLSADGSKLAFVLNQAWQFLDLAGPGGVVDLGTRASNVMLDPSGDRFFYADIRFTPALQPSALFAVNTATGVPRQLTPLYNPPDMVSPLIGLSADGQHLYFAAAAGGFFSFDSADLVNPPAVANLYQAPPVNYFLDSATPDGASILIKGLAFPREDILLVRPASPGSAANLTQGTSPGPVYDHFMSDDSGRFYYARGDAGGRHALLYEVDPGSPTISTRIGHVPTTEFGIFSFRVAPDRSRIVYATLDLVPLGGGVFSSGSTDLFVLELAQHSVSPSLRHFDGIVQFGPYAPDNSFVTFLASDQVGGTANVAYVMNVLDPTQIIRLHDSGVAGLPELAPSPDR